MLCLHMVHMITYGLHIATYELQTTSYIQITYRLHILPAKYIQLHTDNIQFT